MITINLTECQVALSAMPDGNSVLVFKDPLSNICVNVPMDQDSQRKLGAVLSGRPVVEVARAIPFGAINGHGSNN